METFRSIILNPRKLVNSAHEILFQSTKDKEYKSSVSIAVLPREMLLEIFKYLPSDHMKRVALVCREWNTVSMMDFGLWISFFARLTPLNFRDILYSPRGKCLNAIQMVDFRNSDVEDTTEVFDVIKYNNEMNVRIIVLENCELEPVDTELVVTTLKKMIVVDLEESSIGVKQFYYLLRKIVYDYDRSARTLSLEFSKETREMALENDSFTPSFEHLMMVIGAKMLMEARVQRAIQWRHKIHLYCDCCRRRYIGKMKNPEDKKKNSRKTPLRKSS